MNRNVKNILKFLAALIATIVLLYCASATPTMWYHWVGMFLSFAVWIWYFFHVIKDE